jgi:hypothetical protein
VAFDVFMLRQALGAKSNKMHIYLPDYSFVYLQNSEQAVASYPNLFEESARTKTEKKQEHVCLCSIFFPALSTLGHAAM